MASARVRAIATDPWGTQRGRLNLTQSCLSQSPFLAHTFFPSHPYLSARTGKCVHTTVHTRPHLRVKVRPLQPDFRPLHHFHQHRELLWRQAPLGIAFGVCKAASRECRRTVGALPSMFRQAGVPARCRPYGWDQVTHMLATLALTLCHSRPLAMYTTTIPRLLQRGCPEALDT